MDGSQKPRSSWPATGCGRCARSTRPSSCSSGHPTTAGPSRSVRSSSTRACEGALAIGPRNGDARPDPGRPETSTTEAHRAIEAIWRIESARLIAGLARVVGDIGTAEELAQDALVAALEQWPAEGVPERPGAWLMGTAKHRAIDLIRRRKTLERKHEEIGRDVERAQEGLDRETAIDEEVGDDLLGLIFTACHPVLSKDARVALTLRVLGGLTTEEIARAFLVPVATMAQRIVRAKRTLAEAHVRFEVPHGAERVARLASVLDVIYLIFNEGYSATAGKDWVRPALCEEALRLGRILAELAPTEPEVNGLVALMEIQASRLGARVGPSGEPVLLLDQDRARWDRLLIRRGLAALERAERLGGALGPYALQAAIAACHARAPTAADALVAEPSLKSYHLLPAVRGDLLRKLGRSEEARAEFERGASLTENLRERELMQRRAAECAADGMAG